MPASIDEIYGALGRQEWRQARTACAALLRDDPSLAAVHHAIGLSFCGEADFAQALPYLEMASRLDPGTTRWTRDVGAVYAKLARWHDAFATLTPIAPAVDDDALYLYVTAAVESRQTAAALDQLERRSDRPLPGGELFACAHAAALVAEQRYAEAETLLLRCLAAHPISPDVHEALGTLYEASARPDDALRHWEERARLEPGSAYAQLRLALALSERGQRERSRERRRHAERLGLREPNEHSTRLFMMLSDPEESARAQCDAARAAFAGKAPSLPMAGRTTGGSRRRLRLGYLSGECRSTPSYYFYRPFLTNHDRSQVEVFVFSTSPQHDEMTSHYRQWPEHWRDVAHLPDQALIAQLRAEEMDVVVDLSGHFTFHRLGVLAERVAPLQLAYPNYPGTTGCPGIDWVVSDEWTSPPGTEQEYSERVYRMPGGYLGFELAQHVDVGPLPCLMSGRPTFGIFQRFGKCTSEVWDALGNVMAAVPDATLLFHNGDPELDRPGSATVRRLLRELDQRDVDARRVVLRGPLPRRAHLGLVTSVDVSLDTFPYSGQTTTCESLLMGVPVVTLRRPTHAGRVSSALVTRVGHAEWVTDSIDGYRDVAAALVADAGALAQVRRALRADCVACGLTDGRRLARQLELACESLRD